MTRSRCFPAVPRVVPSKDVPEMAVVGKPEVKVDAVRFSRNPAFTIRRKGQLIKNSSESSRSRKTDIDDTEAVALQNCTVIHYKNAPSKYARGQSWPNPHPHDQVSFDNKVRHVGDRVAAVAAETKIAQAALGLIKVEYEYCHMCLMK